MIIGINGYIGSGKDTVGKIIQYWDICNKYPNRICPFVEEDPFVQKESSFRIKKFAAKLKQIASLLTGIPAEKFEDQEFKKTYLPEEWDRCMLHPDEETRKFYKDGCTAYMRQTVREFLQKLGTEAVRNNIHTNAWVNALFAEYKCEGSLHEPRWTHSGFPNWIITDTRFPNEAQAIKDRGGIVVRVERRFYSEDKKSSAQVVTMDLSEKHPSETSLDNWKFDYIINNNSTIEDLTIEVKKMLEHFNLLS